MAGETDPRCRSTRRQWEKIKLRRVIALLFLLLLLLLVVPPLLYNQPSEPAPAIHVGRMGSNPMELSAPAINVGRMGSNPMESAPAIHVGRMGSNLMESAPTIIACRHGRKEIGCIQADRWPHHIQGTRSNPRRLSSDLNQFNGHAVASRGRHARLSPPPSSAADSERYNVSAHEIAAGPNPTRNR